jgi:DNA-binding NarL/FixJ family response regulator
VVTTEAAQPSSDLVDRIFEYILEEFPEMSERIAFLKAATRKEFSGIETYIQKRATSERQQEVLRLFNGRNAREIARRLRISRATVYRLIKTAGKPP